jgi:thiol-disulfide isomerase/thioredoxin
MTHSLTRRRAGLVTIILIAAAGATHVTGQQPGPQTVTVALAYRAPGSGPQPNFSPKGTQVALSAVAAGMSLPPGAIRPAKSGVIKIGPNEQSWIPVLAAADADHPHDIARLFVDRNRNGNFADDGPALTATPKQNEKTKAWWSSFDKVELSIPYGGQVVEPYLVNFWIVREDAADVPDVLRYSVGSWRFGTATVNGVDALVAAMDSDNNAIFDQHDMWSILQASAPDAAKAVLSIAEARDTKRLMFLPGGMNKDVVLEFRKFSPDGRSIEFAVVDKPVTKAADRAADDVLAVERARPRATTPFAWAHDFNRTLAQAKSAGRKVFIDFETTWCGPCKSMDDWIWTDTEVAGLLNAGYVGVKLDGDIEKALVARFKVKGYPTMVVLDSAGVEIQRAEGYLSSKEMLAFLAKR